MKLYDVDVSGNCYKVRLLISLLGIDCEMSPVDLYKSREHKSPEFLRLNPRGQVPVLTDGKVTIWDSQAILVYIARKHGGDDWLPTRTHGHGRGHAVARFRRQRGALWHGAGAG